jgi:hypothetical protein
MLLVDHPADHVAQRRQQITGLNRRARLQFLAQDPTRQRGKRSFAVVTKQRLDQPSPRVSRAFSQPFFTDRRVAEPTVALSVERPIPTQAARDGRCVRQRFALFAPLLLGPDPVSGVAEFADLIDDRSIDGTVKILYEGRELKANVTDKRTLPRIFPFSGDGRRRLGSIATG